MPRTRRSRWMPLLACALGVLLLPAPGRAEPQGDKYALLVGVHRYDKNELRDLPYAEDDMTALADVLKKAGYKRVVLLTQSEGAKEARFLPMAANVRKTLKGLLEDRTADDVVPVAFAGHGVQYAGEDDNYFCPMDAKLADKATLVSLGEVYKDLEASPAGTRLLLADCCRNDPRSDNARAVDKVKLASVTRPQKAVPPGGVAAFFSCSAGEKAYEDSGIKHGVFFHFIIEGLRGKADSDKDGRVDLDELVRYTKKQVPDFVKEIYGDEVRQMPEMIGKTRGTVTLTQGLTPPVEVRIDKPPPADVTSRPRSDGHYMALHGADSAHYQQWVDRVKAAGYRPVYVNGYDGGGSALFAGVALKEENRPAWESRHDLTSDQYQAAIDDLSAKGYRPLSVSGYLSGDSTRFAAAWVKDNTDPRWEARHNLTARDYQAAVSSLKADGLRPAVVSVYQDGAGAYLFAALFAPANESWAARHDLTTAAYRKAVNDWGAKGYRPISVSGYKTGDGPRFAVVFVKDGLAWMARDGLTADEYQREFDKQDREGYRPLSVSGYVDGGEVRYVAVWVKEKP